MCCVLTAPSFGRRILIASIWILSRFFPRSSEFMLEMFSRQHGMPGIRDIDEPSEVAAELSAPASSIYLPSTE